MLIFNIMNYNAKRILSVKSQNASISLIVSTTISFNKSLCFKTTFLIKFYRVIVGFTFNGRSIFLLYRSYHSFAYPTFTNIWVDSDIVKHNPIRMNFYSTNS